MAYRCKYLGIFPEAKDVVFTPETDSDFPFFEIDLLRYIVYFPNVTSQWICGNEIFLVSAADFADACNRKGVSVEDMLTTLLQKGWINETNYRWFEY